MKTILKSVHIYQSYCKKNLAQVFWPTLYISYCALIPFYMLTSDLESVYRIIYLRTVQCESLDIHEYCAFYLAFFEFVLAIFTRYFFTN